MSSERTEPDQELKAMRQCVSAIESLDPEAKARVLFYLCQRYHVNCEQTVSEKMDGADD